MANTQFEADFDTSTPPVRLSSDGISDTAMSSGGLSTGTHGLLVANLTKTAVILPEPTSSDAALTQSGEFPRVLDAGETYRFEAVATGPAHSISFPAGSIRTSHTYASIDPALSTLQVPQAVVFVVETIS